MFDKQGICGDVTLGNVGNKVSARQDRTLRLLLLL